MFSLVIIAYIVVNILLCFVTSGLIYMSILILNEQWYKWYVHSHIHCKQ